MEQRLSLITLGVADLARSQAFYEKLGWQRSVREAPGIAFFQMGGIALALYPRAALAEDAGVETAGRGFAGMALAHNVRSREEVDATIAEAMAAGAKLTRPAADAVWGGYSGCIADPDGFIWEIAWNPGFPLDSDGAVRLPD